MKNLNLYKFQDKHSEKDLEDIYPLSERAFSLMSRNIEKINIDFGAMNVIGILDILEALDYHYSNFIHLKETDNNINQKHEVVAYINRIGQLHYLAKSDFIKNIIPEVKTLLSKVEDIKEFRMKNTSHRSIDFPKGVSEEYQNRQAFSLLGIDTLLFLGKQQYVLPTEVENETIWNFFTPEEDHKILMNQTYKLLETIIKKIT